MKNVTGVHTKMSTRYSAVILYLHETVVLWIRTRYILDCGREALKDGPEQ